MTRQSVNVMQSYCIIVGRLSCGVTLYGPFATRKEAIEYGEIRFPEATREVIIMYREEVTHE